MRLLILLGSIFILLISCSKEKQHIHYESFKEEKIKESDAQQIPVPVFLAKKVLPAKYEKHKKLLNHVESAELFVSEKKDETFDKELTVALKNDDFKPLLYIKSKDELISIYHKKSSQGHLHDFVIYVNDSIEKLGLNLTTDINPEELAELLKNVGIRDIQSIKKRKNQLKNILKQY
ncbi:hypothetical protein UJ101_01347 [Flavobacteriaceae bacterium UJ101]|nr:hypothetical protein UJ101_01347 [Flavobacteriaceae bacterium UJ101]